MIIENGIGALFDSIFDRFRYLFDTFRHFYSILLMFLYSIIIRILMRWNHNQSHIRHNGTH